MNAKNKKHLGKKLKKNVETELITDCQYQLELAQEKIMRLQLDVEKFNNSAYKAKKQVALLEENVKTFNSSAYNAKKEVNRLNSLTKEQNLYISNLEQRLLGLADDTIK